MSSRRLSNSYLVDVFRFATLVLALWANLAIAAFAQGEASIQGTVSDSSGGAVPGVAVRIKNLETGALGNLVTDGAGRYDRPRFPWAIMRCARRKPAFAPK